MNNRRQGSMEAPRLSPGDPAPWFHQRSTSNPNHAFHSAAGRYVVLCFLGTLADRRGSSALDAFAANRRHFDDRRATLFGVTIDPEDEVAGRIAPQLPGLRFFYDFDRKVSRLYGALPAEARADETVLRQWVVLDPTLRVIAAIAFADDRSDVAEVSRLLEALPEPRRFAGTELQAPILLLPNVLEPGLCRDLVDLYDARGGVESGFMRDIDGRTVGVHDHSHKRRRDYLVEDEGLKGRLQERIRRRVLPEILKAHQYPATRMERYLIGCYSAEDGGHFQAHRDNTTKGTAHRRFAVSINLNEAFEGGEVSFPEYGPRSFKPPVGGAVVFSCSLLHAVSPVTAGRRYAFLPFLYDDAAARIREANRRYLGEGGSG